MPVLAELQTTDEVIFFLVLSEYIPVAVNCLVLPSAMLGLVGVTSMETKVAALVGVLLLPPQAEISSITADNCRVIQYL